MTYASTVLIVDDEPSARDTLEALLVGQGHRLVLAANGVEALSKAAELAPDLILLDGMMPMMDGLGLPAPARRPAAGRSAHRHGHGAGRPRFSSAGTGGRGRRFCFQAF